MSTISRIRELSKKLVQLSLDQEGRVEEAKVTETLEALRANPPRGHKTLLREYFSRIKCEIAKGVAKVEYAGKLDEAAVQALQQRLSEHYSRRMDMELIENTDLLVGIRITVGDDVYEDSAAIRLRPLVRALT
jgi:F0F1-type ATP synthase delta subunit